MKKMHVIVQTLPLLLSLVVTVHLHGQNFEEILDGVDGNNFFEVQQRINDYFAEHPDAKGYKQWKRREWYLEPRLYPSGERRHLTKLADKAYRSMPQDATRSTHGSWVFLGPSAWVAGAGGNGGQGRLNAIAIHPTDEDIIYVGASNGGIWKTTNGGTSWTNVSPHLPLLAIADIKLDPNNPNIVYVLTGDGDPVPGEGGSHGQTEVSSIGVIRSTNGGGTWFPTNFSFTHPSPVVPIKLLMHPTDVNIQFIVANDGIYKTTSAWASNTLVFGTLTYDIEFHPANPLIMYASGTNWIRRSVDMGDTWNLVTDDDFGVLNGVTRVELAVTPAASTTVYAIAGDWNPGYRVTLRSLNAGSNNTWTIRDSSATGLGLFSTYCIALEAHPTNSAILYGGMQWINRSATGGSTWSSVVQSTVHADVHDIAITANAVYVASDGGLHKSTDSGATWTDLSAGLAITEIYRIAGTPQSNNRFYIGTQDNGTNRRIASTTFTHVDGGDGMTCRINYNNWDTVFVGRQNGVFRRSINGGTTFANLAVPGDGSAWISPMIMDPIDPDVVFFGKDSLYRSDNGGNTFVYLGMPTGNNLNCLAQGTSNRNRLYASSGAQIRRTDNALTNGGPPAYVNITPGLPNLFITGIAVDPANSMRVFVSLSGYNAGQKVFFSFNGGTSWNPLSGSLPNIPINCIAYDGSSPVSDAIYVGTDIGVFYRDNQLGDWIYYSNSMPAVNVNDLYINPTFGTITAGTYGRGLWRSPLYSGCAANIAHSNPGDPLGGVGFISASNIITSTAEFRNDMGTEFYYTAGQRITLNPGFRARAQGVFEARLGPCPSINTIPFQVPEYPSGLWMALPEHAPLTSPD